MFEKSLVDLIRGIRSHKDADNAKIQKYVATSVEECRKELKQNDLDIKAVALQKLTYLQTAGYLNDNMTFAAFHCLEVMASPKFSAKQIGYLAAAQSFTQQMDVITLTTNLLKKDFASSSYVEVGVAVNGFANIATPDLARDLYVDILTLLNHTRPYVRKRAVLALYKVYLKYPEALRVTWPNLKDRLEDADPGVVSATIGVICELARQNPLNYLTSVPLFFSFLTSSSNNWMLIKVVKLFGYLTPFEPRLSKKLLPIVTNLIRTTPAMSLLYECILTAIHGGMLTIDGGGELARVCVEKLSTFLGDPDQNLKYIGLLALARILEMHPALAAEHRDAVLSCLEDADFSIRMRALDLVPGMVDRDNLVGIVKRLFTHLAAPSTQLLRTATVSLQQAAQPSSPSPSTVSPQLDKMYQAEIIRCVIAACSNEEYLNVISFEWYMTVLVELAYISMNVVEPSLGSLISEQLVDVSVRVKSVRSTAVRLMRRLVSDDLLMDFVHKNSSYAPLLEAAAWILGEYCCYQSAPSSSLPFLLQPSVVDLPFQTQAIYVHNGLKIFVYWLGALDYWNEDVSNEVAGVHDQLKNGFNAFSRSEGLEVQERACIALHILELLPPLPHSASAPPAIYKSLQILFFSSELNAIAHNAQLKVPLPDMDLSAWIDEDAQREVENECRRVDVAEDEPDENNTSDVMFDGVRMVLEHSERKKKKKAVNQVEIDKARAERKARIAGDPFYLLNDLGVDDVDRIPIIKLSIEASPPPQIWFPPTITRSGELPENALPSDEDENAIVYKHRKGKKDSKKKTKDVLHVDKKALMDVDLVKGLDEPASKNVPVVENPLSTDLIRQSDTKCELADRIAKPQNESDRRSTIAEPITKKKIKKLRKVVNDKPKKKKVLEADGRPESSL